jgi:hypothetical protein
MAMADDENSDLAAKNAAEKKVTRNRRKFAFADITLPD